MSEPATRLSRQQGEYLHVPRQNHAKMPVVESGHLGDPESLRDRDHRRIAGLERKSAQVSTRSAIREQAPEVNSTVRKSPAASERRNADSARGLPFTVQQVPDLGRDRRRYHHRPAAHVQRGEQVHRRPVAGIAGQSRGDQRPRVADDHLSAERSAVSDAGRTGPQESARPAVAEQAGTAHDIRHRRSRRRS